MEVKIITIQTQSDIIRKLLEYINIHINELDELLNIEIDRDSLLNPSIQSKYDELILELKKNLSSSRLTCLHKNKHQKQKWPQLNLLRQVLKTNGYKMTPKITCMGYTNNGKKIIKRSFIIEKINY